MLRSFCRQTVGLHLTLGLLAVEGHFFVEFAVEAVAGEEDAQLAKEERDGFHSEFLPVFLFQRYGVRVGIKFPQSTILFVDIDYLWIECQW